MYPSHPFSTVTAVAILRHYFLSIVVVLVPEACLKMLVGMARDTFSCCTSPDDSNQSVFWQFSFFTPSSLETKGYLINPNIEWYFHNTIVETILMMTSNQIQHPRQMNGGLKTRYNNPVRVIQDRK